MHDSSDNEQRLSSQVLELSVQTFKSQKKLGDRAIVHLDQAGFYFTPDKESNTIAVIINHLYGNMLSRWTDFLTTDGEKENRNRDAEFSSASLSRDELMARWEKGWETLFGALAGLTPEDLLRTIYIRHEPHSVIEAIYRQIAHYSNHVGQIVYVAKAYRSSDWQTLSIPKNSSAAYNEQMKQRMTRP